MGCASSRVGGGSDNIGRGEVEARAVLELRWRMGPERGEQGERGGCSELLQKLGVNPGHLHRR